MFRKKKSRKEESLESQASDLNANTVCHLHPSHAITLFCNTCDILICTECVVSSHNGHVYSKIYDISDVKTRELKHGLADIREYYIPNLKARVLNIEDCKLENQTIADDKIANIDARFNKIFFDLKKVREKYVADIKESQYHNEKRLNAAHIELVKDLAKLEGYENDFSSVAHNGSDIQRIRAQQIVTSALDKIHPGQVKLSLNFPVFQEGGVDLGMLQNAVGILESEEELCSDFESSTLSDQIDVKIVSKFKHKKCDITAICPVHDDMAWVHGSDYTENEIISLTGSVQKYADFGFLVVDFEKDHENCLYAGDHENSEIVRLSQDGRQIKTIDTSPLKPLGLCIGKNNDIIVCLVDSPTYYVDMRSKRMVARIDQNEKFTETYEYNDITRLFTKPLRVVENGNNDICVVNRTSSSSGTVVVLNNDGFLRATYKGIENQQFDPLDVKCDKKDRIIVTDGRRLIHLLDSNTQFIQYLLTEREMIEKPWSLAVDTRNRVWVGCDSGTIYVIRMF